MLIFYSFCIGFFSTTLLSTTRWLLTGVLLLLTLATTVFSEAMPVPAGGQLADSPVQANVLSRVMPRFPAELVGAKAGDGEVVLAITLDDDGKVNDSVALEATNEAFAHAALIAVNEWQFVARATPAGSSTATTLALDQPWPRREVLQFNFKRSGVVTSMSHAEAARDGFTSTAVPQLRTVQWQALDSEPQRIKVNMPAFSSSVSTKHDNKPVMIHFVIDQQGYVRVPVITGLEDVAAAKTVLAAVKTWRYTSPMQQKKSVAVEVTNALVLPGTLTE